MQASHRQHPKSRQLRELFRRWGRGQTVVFGNVFYRAAGSSFGAAFSHGGHDNLVRNCIFIECPLAFGSAPWDDKSGREYLTGSLWQEKLLKEVDITRPPYTEKYPELKGFMNYAGESRRNHMRASLLVKCRQVNTGNRDVTDGLVTDLDPGFVNGAQQNFRLRDDSSAFAKIPDFERVPFEQIGLQRGMQSLKP